MQPEKWTLNIGFFKAGMVALEVEPQKINILYRENMRCLTGKFSYITQFEYSQP